MAKSLAAQRPSFETWFAMIRTSVGICPKTGIVGAIVEPPPGAPANAIWYSARWNGKTELFCFDLDHFAYLYLASGECAVLNSMIEIQIEVAEKLGLVVEH